MNVGLLLRDTRRSVSWCRWTTVACVSPSYWRPILRANVQFFFEALFGTCVLSIMGSLRGAQDCMPECLGSWLFRNFDPVVLRFRFEVYDSLRTCKVCRRVWSAVPGVALLRRFRAGMPMTDTLVL